MDGVVVNVRASGEVQELFRLHYLALVRLAMRLVDDQPTAEDVVQDVFAGFARTSAVVDDPPNYLRRAVVNGCRSTLRRRRVARAFLVRSTGSEHGQSADADALLRDRRHTMLLAIRRLPRRQREVVVLRFYEDLSVAEIATLLNVSAGAVSSALNRALAALALVTEDHHDR